MKNLKVILFAVLCIVTLFSVFKYISAQREKNLLLYNLKQAEDKVTGLETEKQGLQRTIEKEKELQNQLNEENKGLKDNLKAYEEKLAKYEDEYNQAKKTIEELSSDISLYKDERDRLMIQFAEASQQRDSLEARLGSIEELKKAIKELKAKSRGRGVSRKAREAVYKKYEIKESAKIYEVSDGNRGFVVRDGRPTYYPKIKIKVEPALEEK